jgi:hypothetical protein
MNPRVICFMLVFAQCFAFMASSAQAAKASAPGKNSHLNNILLPAPKPKSVVDYNYSNDFIGSNATGVPADVAGDIDESHLPLSAPTLKSSEVIMFSDQTISDEPILNEPVFDGL